ncbi:MAG: Rrf2 family transcriptional regulator [Armatimonadia bacterium]|nr:Rrf2 family transcriptional regulator [Armatimonadia bacterium]
MVVARAVVGPLRDKVLPKESHMESILRISDAAAIGLHAMTCLAEAGSDEPISALKIAGDLQVSEAHLSKVLQRLGRRGLVVSKRGPGGGFVLGKPAAEITLAEIYEAIEGPLPQGECLLGRSECALGSCVLGGLLQEVQSQVSDYFARTTLQNLLDRHTGTVCNSRARIAAGAE